MYFFKRPLWVFQDGYILFETFTLLADEIQDFLITISEPVVRTKLIHEYVLTPYSLYAAITAGITNNEILRVLKKISKNPISIVLRKMILFCTKLFGKLYLILFKSMYFIYTPNSEILTKILNDKQLGGIKFSLISKNYNLENEDDSSLQKNLFIKKSSAFSIFKSDYDLKNKINFIFSINVEKKEIENVKRRCVELDCQILEEYDFINDGYISDIKIDLSPSTKIRAYQEKAISKMYNKGRVRSGVIVLPCGSGKTVVGISSASILKKTSLIICNSTVSVDQWKKQFLKWSTISKKKIRSFVAGEFSSFPTSDSEIIITTYSMISFGGQRAKLSASFLSEIKAREWGLVILDEVHVVPANVFRKVFGFINTQCKLGLTATLLREDRKVGDIGFLIGPKLFEANWLDLEKSGFLAMACCTEIYCPMPSKYYDCYLNGTGSIRQILCALNPNKARICDFLIRYHEKRGDRILVFSDNVFALRSYATKMTRSFIYGATGSLERMKILKNFQEFNGQTLFISRIGDTSIDLPEANVILQISSHYGSRRQEAQRLGRILRPKFKSGKAFFYSLVSSQTEEMFYASKRQQFLVSQGYDFKTVVNLWGIDSVENLVFSTQEERNRLLKQIILNQMN